jgi:hypothetical protein
LLQLFKRRHDPALGDFTAFWCVHEHNRQCLKSFCDVESDVGDWVRDKGQGGVEDRVCDDLAVEGWRDGL